MAARSPMTVLLAPICGFVAGVGAAVAIAVAPDGWAERLIGRAGVVPVGPEPLGTIARTVLALCGGAFVAAAVWASLMLLCGPARPLSRTSTRRTTTAPPAPGDTEPGENKPLRADRVIAPVDYGEEAGVEALLRRLETAARR